jgi:GNAT superfamily N-acetyltransferase
MDIVSTAERPIDGAAVVRLYNNVEWWPARTPEQVQSILATGPAVGAWDGDELIGFARAVSDGCFRAYVEDVVVRQDHRRGGTATRMLKFLIGLLSDIDVVSLFCGADLVPFYEHAGFSPTSQVVLHRTRQ